MKTIVRDIMSPTVHTIKDSECVSAAAKLMKEHDIGSIPVRNGDKLVGMITDRDVALRTIAKEKDPYLTPVSMCMTKDVKYCYQDQSIDEVSKNLSEIRLRRLPVLDRDKKLVGILSLGDLAIHEKPQSFTHETLRKISL